MRYAFAYVYMPPHDAAEVAVLQVRCRGSLPPLEPLADAAAADAAALSAASRRKSCRGHEFSPLRYKMRPFERRQPMPRT